MSSSITIIKKITLSDFPSGSSLEFYKDRIYLIGDDAKHMLVLDSEYNHLDSVPFFENIAARIAKTEKADFEASTLIETEGSKKLLIMGSGSKSLREKAVLIDLERSKDSLNIISTYPFITRLKQNIEEINIEGAAMVKEALVLSNRANNTNKKNQLIITTPGFLDDPDNANFTVNTIDLGENKTVIGISGLAYVAEKDLLLFTASTEDTDNAYADGAIGDSYIGWISEISQKLKGDVLKPDQLINLSQTYKEFANEKIESICVEKTNGEGLLIHLAADNDQGDSKLFKVRLKLD